jgi:hypothetical protein
MSKTAPLWSLTSLREKLIKIGAKVVSHGRSHGEVQVKRGRIRVTSAGLQCLFGIRGLSPLA